MKLRFDMKQLAVAGAAGIGVNIFFLVASDFKLLLSAGKAALMGMAIGLLVQLACNIFGSKVTNSLMWMNIIVCLSIFAVIITYNLASGRVDLESSLLAFIVSSIAGIAIVFYQNRKYLKINKQLEEKKLAQIEKNKKAE